VLFALHTDQVWLQKTIDMWFVIIFTCEAVSKIIVYGLLLQPGAYLKSPWNILDFATVIVGIVLLTVGDTDGQLTSLKSLRTLRALRPIRMASRAPGMKVCWTVARECALPTQPVTCACGDTFAAL